MSTFKPMLAAPADLDVLKYPVLLSPKLDGIRAVVYGGKLLSRTLKPIPNKYIQSRFAAAPIGDLEGLDGELIVGSATNKNAFQATTSGVMSLEGKPDFIYNVFDIIDPKRTLFFQYRDMMLNKSMLPSWVHIVPQTMIKTRAELDRWEAFYLKRGYEGVMLRDPEGFYKFGRSTVKEGGLLKLKRFEDDEGTIVDFEEKEHNDNPATKNELGRTKRSSAKAGKRPAGTLGTLVLSVPGWKSPVRIGTGLDEELRSAIWNNRRAFIGRRVKFRYQAVGVVDQPRIASFVGFRHDDD